ncbi:hypothetical protein H0N98_03575 [Candidatus Micrarchaeota archaeon]|nr:hypothetical protein [Candidatus Micrarchaeota archaeon]
MTAACKKAGPSQVETPLEELRVLPDHMFGKVGGFDVHFKKDGQVEARRSYSNVGIAVMHEEGGRTSEKKEVVKEVEVKLAFGLIPLPPDIFFSNERIHADFRLGEKKHSIEGMISTADQVSWLEDEKGNVSFSDRFIQNVDDDVRSFKKKLTWALQFDSRLSPAFKAEMSSQEALEKFVSELADEAERISERSDVKKNPLLLLPVFNKARERGVTEDVVTELELRRAYIEKTPQLDVLIRILNDFRKRSRREFEENSMQEKQ